MSLAALALPIGYTVLFGIDRSGDEGTAAHLWQLLMAGQLPVIAYFAITAFPKAPRQATILLVLQGAAFLAAAAPVFLLGL